MRVTVSQSSQLRGRKFPLRRMSFRPVQGCCCNFTLTRMDSREKDSILYVIGKLRSITRMVQLAPFVYAFLYIFIIAFYPWASFETAQVLDTLFYVSPVVIAINLIESRILKLCKWHKTSCYIPLIPQIAVFIDAHIVRFTTHTTQICVGVFLTMLALFLISAYKVFFTNGSARRK